MTTGRINQVSLFLLAHIAQDNNNCYNTITTKIMQARMILDDDTLLLCGASCFCRFVRVQVGFVQVFKTPREVFLPKGLSAVAHLSITIER